MSHKLKSVVVFLKIKVITIIIIIIIYIIIAVLILGKTTFTLKIPAHSVCLIVFLSIIFVSKGSYKLWFPGLSLIHFLNASVF